MKRIFFLLLVVIPLVSGCQFAAQIGIDSPTVQIQTATETFQATQSSYCWGNKCADYIGPEAQMKEEAGYIVQPNERITIQMDYQQQKVTEMHAALVQHDEYTNIALTNHQFHAPLEQGEYIYTVSYWWKDLKEGSSSSYAFKLIVK
jgi:hypothetical protein